MSCLSKNLHILIICITGLVLTSCSVVGSRQSVEYYAYRDGCKSSLGSYTLPKQIVKFTITESSGRYNMTTAQQDTIPDNPDIFTFCLDHLVNVFADDKVAVKRSKGTNASPFLEVISSNAADNSVEIIRSIIGSIFSILSNTGQFSFNRSSTIGGGGNIVASHEVDPFDQDQLAEINQAINEYGFCLVLEEYSYNAEEIRADEYCRNPEHIVYHHPSPITNELQQQRFLIERPHSGIFYRPKKSYGLAIYTKQDPKGPGSWRLSFMQTLLMENISPVISVGVQRAAFTAQKTALVFNEGTLEDVCIARGGQVAGFIDIPLDIVYGVVNLPAETIKNTIQGNANVVALVQSQDKLLKAQQAYIDYLAGSTGALDDLSPSEKVKQVKLGSIADEGDDNFIPKNPRITSNTPDKTLFTADTFASTCMLTGEAKDVLDINN